MRPHDSYARRALVPCLRTAGHGGMSRTYVGNAGELPAVWAGYAQGLPAANGFAVRSPGKRRKSESLVQRTAWCSIAIAAI